MGKKLEEQYNRVVEHYRRTVDRGASIEEACQYGLAKRLLKLPIPKEPMAVLVQRVTRAQRRQQSVDNVLKLPYNTNICYLFGDEYRWIKQDKATLNNKLFSSDRKRRIAVGILASDERNRQHWNRTRSDDEQLELKGFDLADEVQWKLNQSSGEENTGTND
jgi:hypothetical protein